MTVSFTGICYGLPSATNAGPGVISNATATKKHSVEDAVQRPMERGAEPERPSALPTREQLLTGVPGVVEATQRGLGSA